MSNRKKRVCLLIYNLGSGGAEHVLSQWSFLLSEQFEIFMTVFDGETKPHYDYYGKLYDLNVKSDNSSLLRKIKNVLKRAVVLSKFVKEQNIDLVISFCNEANLANTISLHRAKKVCSIRSTSDIGANPFVNYVIKSKKNMLILQTEALRNLLIDKYGEWVNKKIHVLGNPFDTEAIISKSKELPPEFLRFLLSNKKTIVNIASIKPAKNHENLLRTFELICNEIPDVYLILVGADPVDRAVIIKKMAEKSNYSKQIIFVGELDNPFSVVSRSSLFVLPSLSEGIPNALAEAMICGVPVIASNCPTGPQELLTEYGDLVEYNDRGYSISRYGVLVKPFKNNGKTDYEFTEENHFFANAIIDIFNDKELFENLVKKAKNGSERFNNKQYKSRLVQMVEEIINVC